MLLCPVFARSDPAATITCGRAATIQIRRVETDDLEESDPCADVGEDEDELEENKPILEDC